ncbi:MAG TPA: response regulator, partial [Polyangiaceae bacterium]|nr:response regulator [Polyangiaceae bacterium]
ELLTRQFGVPVVYLTAHADDRTLERAKRTEPQGYLLKPVKSAELHSTIEVALYRHAMSKRLRERERWYASALSSMADAVIAVDLSGTVTFMNPAAEGLTGVTASAGIGRPARDVMRLLPSGAAVRDESPLERALAEQGAAPLGDAAIETSGSARTITSDGARPLLEDGEVRGAVMVFRDVTEERKMQAQLELSDRLSSLATMAAGVAHEVNNALTVVVPNAVYIANELENLSAELRSAPPATAEVLRRLDELVEVQGELRTAADSIGDTMRALKAFSRPTLPASGEADVRRAIQWAVRSTGQALPDRARFSVDAGELPPVKGDEARLGQALAQLLTHATYAVSRQQAGQSEVAITAYEDGQDCVAIEIRDAGPTLPREMREHVFEPFFADPASSSGRGIGLAICHGIVRSLGGEIALDSVEGKGNTFRIRLPRAEHRPARTVEPQSLPVRARRARILAVDDQAAVLRIVERMLREHDVVCVESAREALDRIERGETFDLIFSDVMMPGMSGLDFYEALLSRDPALARQVVFISGGAVTERAEAFLRSVPNSVITKPFTMASLLRKVEDCLDGRELGRRHVAEGRRAGPG